MSSLRDKKILVGVTGSIAAYKTSILVRLLARAGAQVQVIMTEGAKDFITPVTLSALSGRPVYSSFIRPGGTGEWTNHVELGLWADVMVIAPASANTLSKMAAGICDNLLLATYLSARCPVMVAPAMDLDMFLHAATREALQKLRSFGIKIIDPTYGELASGLVGQGRMEEPEQITRQLELFFSRGSRFGGKKVLVTAGPTYEPIDPVRFIGNYSTGKMGFALADQFADQGADVVLVSGSTALQPHNGGIKWERVATADQMHSACLGHYDSCDIAVLSAAVADFRPKTAAQEKIKKQGASLIVELEPTTDILADLGSKKKNQLLVGFALETRQEAENAQKKLREKNLDLIVLNSLRDEGAGFGHDTNKITLIDNKNNIEKFELKSKAEVAEDIIDRIFALMQH